MASKHEKEKFALHNANPEDWADLARAQGHTGPVEKITEEELKEKPDEETQKTREKVECLLGGVTNGLSPLE